MKRLIFVGFICFCFVSGFAQTQVKSGAIVPNKNNPTVLLPGNYTANKGSLIFLPNSNSKKSAANNTQNNQSNSSQNNIGLLNDNTGSLTATSLNNSFNNSNLSSNSNAGELQPLSLVSTNNSNQATNNNQDLAPLTSLMAGTTTPKSAVVKGLYANNRIENIDPSLLNGNKIASNNTSKNSTSNTPYVMPPLSSIETNNASKNSTSNAPYTMPPLASIETNSASKNNTSNSPYTMPPLASIETNNNATATNNGMPELAPIEVQKDGSKNNQNVMPELAPIEYQSNNNQQNNNPNNKVKTNLRGLIMPRGTTLDSKNKMSFILKPGVPLQEQEVNNEPTYSTKPGAGGGMGMPTLAPIEEEIKQEGIPALAPIEAMSQPNNTIPELAVIEKNNQQQVVAPRKVLATEVQPQQQVAKTPCQHTHVTPCPCCVAKPIKKWSPKKKWTAKKVYQKPRTTYVYQYEQLPQQPSTVRERIVYVPIQQQQPQQQQPQKQQVQQQQIQQQPQEKVVYKDYTKVYVKETPQTNSNCNCPKNATNTTQKSEDPKKYYNPSGYQGLTSGPTSGDYPVAGKTSEAPLQYSFYLNPRGKYSVGIYNQYFSVLLSQNGSVIEYKINGDPNVDPKTYKPKLNYFGKPESVAGIPIEYNFNRSVHKIGSIKFDYDFEGFFKVVGSSNVLYNSRSSLSKVDAIGVQYDAGGNVTSVDANNGLIQFNP